MAAELTSKKSKTENIEQQRRYVDPIFETFANDAVKQYELDRDRLESAFAYMKSGTNDMNLAILEIIDANPRSSVSFADATLYTKVKELNPNLNTPPGFLLEDIFVDGFDVLNSFLNTCTVRPRIPKDEMKQQALAKLLRFLLKQNQDVLFEEQTSKGKWTITLAQHLLSKLAVNGSYVVDYSLEPALQQLRVCPCNEQDLLIGEVGDNSYGYDKGWHGMTDMIINDLPVSVVRDNDKDTCTVTRAEYEDDASDDPSESSIEVSNSETFTKRDLSQVMSQTIVFSFLQHKLNRLGNNLIPGIGIGTQDIVVYFYDCENDVFLSSKPVQFFCGKELYLPGVLFLWLVLNYKLFCSGVPDSMKAYKAKFFNRADDSLQRYYYEVAKPLHIPRENLKQSYFGWSVNQVIHFETRKPNVDYIGVI